MNLICVDDNILLFCIPFAYDTFISNVNTICTLCEEIVICNITIAELTFWGAFNGCHHHKYHGLNNNQNGQKQIGYVDIKQNPQILEIFDYEHKILYNKYKIYEILKKHKYFTDGDMTHLLIGLQNNIYASEIIGHVQDTNTIIITFIEKYISIKKKESIESSNLTRYIADQLYNHHNDSDYISKLKTAINILIKNAQYEKEQLFLVLIRFQEYIANIDYLKINLS